MTSIKGTINCSGQPADALRIIAYQEKAPALDSPGDITHPGWSTVTKLGETSTDLHGRFHMSVVSLQTPAGDHAFKTAVFIRVMQGNKLIWTSPKKDLMADNEFLYDIAPGLPINQKAVIRGTLTDCARPAAGRTVKAFEKTIISFIGQDGHTHSRSFIRLLGQATVSPAGQFSIPFLTSTSTGGATITVYIEVFDGIFRLWKSDEQHESSVTEINAEIFPGCSPGTSVIMVIGSDNTAIPRAEVYVNGTLAGVTNNAGQLLVRGLVSGNLLAARVLQKESRSPRQGHSDGSTQNWNYRVYTTSITIRYDSNGDHVTLPQQTVSNPTEIQYLRIDPNNTLIGFNLLVSVEWDTTAKELQYYSDRLKETSELLYNATDGQFLIERINIADKGANWQDADIQILANLNYATDSSLSGILSSGRGVKMNPYDAYFPGNFLHELGHYLFGVRDEYPGPGDVNIVCTPKSLIPGTPFSNGGSKDSCPMRGAQDESRKKFCSNHPANPHAHGTRQGDTDCWTTIANAYHGGTSWKILTPNNRLVIPDRLPDSGIPLGTNSTVPSRADQAGSYIPLKDWKPKFHSRNVIVPGELPAQKVRALYNRRPVDMAKVYLQDTTGYTIYEGFTGPHASLPGNVSTRPGEIIMLGAHKGYKIIIGKVDGDVYYSGSHTIGANDALSIDVELTGHLIFGNSIADGVSLGGIMINDPASVVSFIPDRRKMVLQPAAAGHADEEVAEAAVQFTDNDTLELQVVRFDQEDQPHYLRSMISHFPVDPLKALHGFSFDRQLEIMLPEETLKTAGELVIEDAFDVSLPEATTGYRVIAGPYHIHATGGEDLTKPGTIFTRPGGATALYERDDLKKVKLALLQYQPSNRSWRAVKATPNEYPLQLTATIQSLGIYALAEETERASGE